MLRLAPLLKQLTIKSKSLDYRKFDVNYVDPVEGDLGWAQRPFLSEIERQYNAGHPARVIILKARQLGISTATEGVLYNWSFLHPGTNGLVMTHERPQSSELFGMTKTFWDTWPFKRLYTPTSQTKGELAWLETKSKIRVATAKNVQSGRGSTLHAVHASECAFYDDPNTLWTGLNQTIPRRHGTIVVLESTANGVGNWFYDQWMAAEEGESVYTPLFFPWWKHPEYRMATTLTIKSELTDEERLIAALMKQGGYEDVTYEALAWRRYAIVNLASGDISAFRQEYPSTPEEAFVTSGQPIFDPDSVRAAYEPMDGVHGYFFRDAKGRVRFVRSESGNVTIFRAPRPGDTRQDRYFIGADPSKTIGGDPACAQVINRSTLEQVAVWHGRQDPVSFAKELELLGEYYNTCMICPETDGGGAACIATLINDSYPSIWQHRQPDRNPGKVAPVFGWLTNYQRKRWGIGLLQRLFVERKSQPNMRGGFTLHDRKTYMQFRSYVQHDDGSMGSETGAIHDDAVMAMSIAVAASNTEGPFVPDATADNTILEIYQQEYQSA